MSLILCRFSATQTWLMAAALDPRSVPARILASRTKARSNPIVSAVLEKGPATTKEFAEKFDALYGSGSLEGLARAFEGAGNASISELYGEDNSEINKIAAFYDAFDALFTKRGYIGVDMDEWYNKLKVLWDTSVDGIALEAKQAAVYLSLSYIEDGSNKRSYYYLPDKSTMSAFIKGADVAPTYAHEFLLMCPTHDAMTDQEIPETRRCSAILSAFYSRRIKLPVGASAEETRVSEETGVPMDEGMLSEIARVVAASVMADKVFCPMAEGLLYAMAMSSEIPQSEILEDAGGSAPMEVSVPDGKSLETSLSELLENVARASKRMDDSSSDEPMRKYTDDIFSCSDDDVMGSPMRIEATAEDAAQFSATFDPNDENFLHGLAIMYLLVLGEEVEKETVESIGEVLSRRIREYIIATIHEFLAVDLDVSRKRQDRSRWGLSWFTEVIADYRNIAPRVISLFTTFQNKYTRVKDETSRVLYPDPANAYTPELAALMNLTQDQFNSTNVLIAKAQDDGRALSSYNKNVTSLAESVGRVSAAIVLIADKQNETLIDGVLAKAQEALPSGERTLFERLAQVRNATTDGERVDAMNRLHEEFATKNIDADKVPKYNPWALIGISGKRLSTGVADMAAAGAQTMAQSFAEVKICGSDEFRFVHRPLLTNTLTYKQHADFLSATNQTEIIPMAGHSHSRYLPEGQTVDGQTSLAISCAFAAIRLQEMTRYEEIFRFPAGQQIDSFLQCVANNDKTLDRIIGKVVRDSNSRDETNGVALANAFNKVVEYRKNYETKTGKPLTVVEINPVLFTGNIALVQFSPVYQNRQIGMYIGPEPKQNVHYASALNSGMICTEEALLHLNATGVHPRYVWHAFHAGAALLQSRVANFTTQYDVSAVNAKIEALYDYMKRVFSVRGLSITAARQRSTAAQKAALLLNYKALDEESRFFDHNSKLPEIDIEFMTFTHDGVVYGPLVSKNVLPLYPAPLPPNCDAALELQENALAKEASDNAEKILNPGSTAAQKDTALQNIKRIMEQISFLNYLPDARDTSAFRVQRQQSAISRRAKPSVLATGLMRGVWHAGQAAKGFVANWGLQNLKPVLWGGPMIELPGGSVVVAGATKDFVRTAGVYGATALVSTVAVRGTALSPYYAVPLVSIVGKYAFGATLGAQAQLAAMATDTLLYTISEAAGRSVDKSRNLDLLANMRDQYNQKLVALSSSFVFKIDVAKSDSNAENRVVEARKVVETIRTKTSDARRLFNAFLVAKAQVSLFKQHADVDMAHVIRFMLGVPEKTKSTAVGGNIAFVFAGQVLFEGLRSVTQRLHTSAAKADDTYKDEYAILIALVQFGVETLLTYGAADALAYVQSAATKTADAGTKVLLFLWRFAMIALAGLGPLALRGIVYAYSVGRKGNPGLFSFETAAVEWLTGGDVRTRVGYQLGAWFNSAAAYLDEQYEEASKDIWAYASGLLERLRTDGVSFLFTVVSETALRGVFMAVINFFSAGLSGVRTSALNWLFASSKTESAIDEVIASLRALSIDADLSVVPMVAPRKLGIAELAAKTQDNHADLLVPVVRLMEINVAWSDDRLQYAYSKAGGRSGPDMPSLDSEKLYDGFVELWASGLMPRSVFNRLTEDIKEDIATLIKKGHIVRGVSKTRRSFGEVATKDPDLRPLYTARELYKDAIVTGDENLFPTSIGSNYGLALAHVLLRVLAFNIEEQTFEAMSDIFKGISPGTLFDALDGYYYAKNGLIAFADYEYNDDFENAVDYWNAARRKKAAASVMPVFVYFETSLHEPVTHFMSVPAHAYVSLEAGPCTGIITTREMLYQTFVATGKMMWVRPPVLFLRLPEVAASCTLTPDIELELSRFDLTESYAKYALAAVFYNDNSCLVYDYASEKWLYVSDAANYGTVSQVEHALSALQQRKTPIAFVYVAQDFVTSTSEELKDRLKDIHVRLESPRSEPMDISSVGGDGETSSGIFNTGVSCFYAAALQALARVPEFKALFSLKMAPAPPAQTSLDAVATSVARTFPVRNLELAQDRNANLLANILEWIVARSPSTREDQMRFIVEPLYAIAEIIRNLPLQNASPDLTEEQLERLRKTSTTLAEVPEKQQTEDSAKFITEMHTFATNDYGTIDASTRFTFDNADDFRRLLAEFDARPDVVRIRSLPLFKDIGSSTYEVRTCPNGHMTCEVSAFDAVITKLGVPKGKTERTLISEIFKVRQHTPTDELFVCERCSLPSGVQGHFTSFAQMTFTRALAPNLIFEIVTDGPGYYVVPDQTFYPWRGSDPYTLRACIFKSAGHYTCAVRTGATWTHFNDSKVDSYKKFANLYQSRKDAGFEPRLVFYTAEKRQIAPEFDLEDAIVLPRPPRSLKLLWLQDSDVAELTRDYFEKRRTMAFSFVNARTKAGFTDGDALEDALIANIEDANSQKQLRLYYEAWFGSIYAERMIAHFLNPELVVAGERVFRRRPVVRNVLSSDSSSASPDPVVVIDRSRSVSSSDSIPAEDDVLVVDEAVIARAKKAVDKAAKDDISAAAALRAANAAATKARTAYKRRPTKETEDALTAALQALAKASKEAETTGIAMIRARAALQKAEKTAPRVSGRKRAADDERQVSSDIDDSVVQTGPKRRRLKEGAEETFMALQALSRK